MLYRGNCTVADTELIIYDHRCMYARVKSHGTGEKSFGEAAPQDGKVLMIAAESVGREPVILQ